MHIYVEHKAASEDGVDELIGMGSEGENVSIRDDECAADGNRDEGAADGNGDEGAADGIGATNEENSTQEELKGMGSEGGNVSTGHGTGAAEDNGATYDKKSTEEELSGMGSEGEHVSIGDGIGAAEDNGDDETDECASLDHLSEGEDDEELVTIRKKLLELKQRKVKEGNLDQGREEGEVGETEDDHGAELPENIVQRKTVRMYMLM